MGQSTHTKLTYVYKSPPPFMPLDLIVISCRCLFLLTFPHYHFLLCRYIFQRIYTLLINTNSRKLATQQFYIFLSNPDFSFAFCFHRHSCFYLFLFYSFAGLLLFVVNKCYMCVVLLL